MQDEPTPIELLTAVAEFLRKEITPQISGATAFKLRVAINALDLSVRQMQQAGQAEAAEAARLAALLGHSGELRELNDELADRIKRGEVDLSTPGLADHLWHTTMEKLSVDQPGYASYRREKEREQGS